MNSRVIEISNAIRELRHRRGLKQDEVARLSGKAQARISELEKSSYDARLSTLSSVLDVIDANLMVIPFEKVAEVRLLLEKSSQPEKPSTDVFDDIFVNVGSDDYLADDAGDQHGAKP